MQKMEIVELSSEEIEDVNGGHPLIVALIAIDCLIWTFKIASEA